MAVKFPFEKIGDSLFGIIYRPIAKVLLQSPSQKTWAETWMIVDTGADFTILPRYLSEDLGVSLEKDCIKDTTFGVGGQQTLYLCKEKIKAKIGSFERQIPLAFLDSNEVPPLMGRLGFLETFDTYLTKTHITIFKD